MTLTHMRAAAASRIVLATDAGSAVRRHNEKVADSDRGAYAPLDPQEVKM